MLLCSLYVRSISLVLLSVIFFLLLARSNGKSSTYSHLGTVRDESNEVDGNIETSSGLTNVLEKEKSFMLASEKEKPYEYIKDNDDKENRGPRAGNANFQLHGVWYSYSKTSFGMTEESRVRRAFVQIKTNNYFT